MNENSKKRQDYLNKKKYHEEKLNKQKKTSTRFFVMSGLLIATFYLLVISYSVINSGERLTVLKLLEPIASELLGALPALILLEIVAKQILGEASSDEISSHIASTLMGDVDILRDIDPARRKIFVTNTISTLTGSEDAEMVSGFLNPYLIGKYNTRKYQHYYIHVHADLIGNVDDWIKIFSPQKYISVEESLKYTKHYGRQISTAVENYFPQDFSIHFCVYANDVHDKYNNDPNCMFREYFFVDQKDMQNLSQTVVSDEDKLKFVKEFMDVRLIIKDGEQDNDEKAKINKIIFDQSGIHIFYHSTHSVNSQDILFRLSFLMPRLIGHVEFVAQYGEPTFCPSITFVYPKKSKMRPFLLMTGSEIIHADDADEGETAWNMQLQNQWVYPMSGIVFSLDLPEEIVSRAKSTEDNL